MRTFRFFENTGGMNLQDNDTSLRDGDAEEITNLHANARGSWTSSNVGFVNLNATPLQGGVPVTSLYEYVTLDSISYVMATAADKLLTFEPSTGANTVIHSGLAAGRMDFVTFQGLLIGCNGQNAPIKWDGMTSVQNLAGWAPTIPGISPGSPSISAIFANRLIFSGDDNNPSMIYISALEDPEDFTPTTGAASAGAIQIAPGDGDRVTGIKTLFLPLNNEEVLVIFKETSTYMLTGSDSESFALQKVSDEFGAVGHHAVINVGNELMFLSREGVTTLSTATLQGNLTTGLLSNRVRATVTELNPNLRKGFFAVHMRNRQEVWWFLAQGSFLYNQLVLVYNYGINQAWSRRSGIRAASGMERDGKLYTGNYEGVVQQQLRGNTYAGEDIPWVYRTGFNDLASPRMRKRIKDIEVFLRQISQVEINVNLYWDFRRGSANRQSRPLSVQMEGSNIYGTGHYGEDVYNLSGTSILKFIPDGSGRFFQMEFTGTKPVEIEGWTITAIEGGFR